MDKYTALAVVGEGTYGTVAKCVDAATGRLVAVKKLKNAMTTGGRHSEMIVREIGLLRALADDHVVPMIDAFRHGRYVYMVFPLLRCNMYAYLELQGGALSIEDAKRCVYQVLKGLNYVHGRNVVHRDIKPENILLTVDGVVKICDFGVSRMFSSDGFLNLSDAIGTLWYQSPEILMGSKNYDSAADVWSVGILLTELINRWPVVAESTTVSQVHGIAKLLGDGGGGHRVDGDLAAVDEFLRVRGVYLGSTMPSVAAVAVAARCRTVGGRKSYAVADTASALRRVYADWPGPLLETVACCLQVDSMKRKNAAQLLEMDFFTIGSFSTRFDRELRVKLRRHDYGGGGGWTAAGPARDRAATPACPRHDERSMAEETRDVDETRVFKKQKKQ